MGNVFDLLDDEWRRLSADRGACRRLRDVCDVAGGAATLAEVERYVRSADPAGADRVLLALVRPGRRRRRARGPGAPPAVAARDPGAGAALVGARRRRRAGGGGRHRRVPPDPPLPDRTTAGEGGGERAARRRPRAAAGRAQGAGHPVGRPGGARGRRPSWLGRGRQGRSSIRRSSSPRCSRTRWPRASSTATTPSSSPGPASAGSGSPTSPTIEASARGPCGIDASAPRTRSPPPGWPADVDDVVVLPTRSRRPAGPVAVVLSSGANLGAVQVGVLRALVEHGVRPDLIVGCSIGALNGAALAAGPDGGRRRPPRAGVDHRRAARACCPGRGCRRRWR